MRLESRPYGVEDGVDVALGVAIGEPLQLLMPAPAFWRAADPRLLRIAMPMAD